MNHLSKHTKKVLKAASLLKSFVTPTLGPSGTQVVIFDGYYSSPTKDGVTVAKKFKHSDPKINAIADVIKQAATQTNLSQGDGTTTSILLATSLIEQGISYSHLSGMPLATVSRSLKEALPHMLSFIDSHSTPSTPEDLLSIATISSNNDPMLGKLVYDTFSEVGPEGVILLEDSPAPFTTSSFTNGYSISSGYLSPHFINSPSTKEVIYEDAVILMTDSKIKSSQEILPFLQYLAQNTKPGIIIADDFDPQILQMLIVNVINTPLRVTAIKSPSFGENRSLLLQDIAVYTSSKIVSESKGEFFSSFSPESLGHASKVVISSDTSTFFCEHNPQIDERIELINSQIPNLQPYFQETYRKRAASLRSKVATIHVGAPSDAERSSTRDRIEDAIRSIRQASLHGIIPGGGTIPYLLSLTTTFPPLKKALEAPIELLAYPNQEVVKDVIQRNPLLGFDALTQEYKDLKQHGIIDATSTLKEALTTAISVASLLISSHEVITTTPDESE